LAGKIIADIIEAPYDKITLNVGNTTVLTANGTGITYVPTSNLNINIGSTANLTLGNVVATTANISGLITANGGIKFPATQNASADANTLDDYEEGTWEPTIRPETGSFTSVTYHPDTGGKYIKIGQLVYLTGSVRWTALNTTGGSGNAYIGDLPFSCASRTNGDNADGCGSAFTPIWNGSGSNVPTVVRMINNSSTLFISTQDGDAVVDNVAVGDLGSACFITFTIVMHTT
jgi:hypothetical protein